MASHALRRLLTTLAVLVVVSLLSFVLAEATVDPAVGLAGAEATSADVEAAPPAAKERPGAPALADHR